MITIIPAIDIIDGQCVRLTQGDYDQKSVYSSSPADVAKSFEDVGLQRIHLVDLEGAKASEPRNLHVLEQVASHTSLDIQWGGGIKSTESLRQVIDAGAHRAICGSVAVTEPELFEAWLTEFGPERIILGADVRHGKVATHGWLQESQLTADQLIANFPKLTQAIVTDISRDGMLAGPAFELYVSLQQHFPDIEIIASGGISSIDDICRLDTQGTRSVIVGKALYENKITLKELKIWL